MKGFDLSNNHRFLESRQNGRHFVFRNLKLKRPEWQEILNHLNRNIMTKQPMNVFDNMAFTYFDAEKLSTVGEMVKEIKKITTKNVSAQCYISFLEISRGFGRHYDESEVFFWQVQGRTHWVVEDQGVHEYELTSNDMIYIPVHTVHTVTPLCPRAGISIGIDPDDYVQGNAPKTHQH